MVSGRDVPTVKIAVTRKVNIPKEKYIFFPITNAFQAAEGTEEQEREYLFGIINPLGSNLICTLDGVPVPVVFNPNTPIVRSQSPVFTLHIFANNIFNAPPGNYSPTVSDGYCRCFNHYHEGCIPYILPMDMQQDVTYQLTVE